MSEKNAKHFRKLTRGAADKLAEHGYKKALFKIARHRDMIGLIAIVEGIMIIVLLIWR